MRLTDGEAGRPSIGVWSGLAGTAGAMLLASSGFDWIGLDAQHGTWDDATLVDTLRALPSAPTEVVVRVGANDPAVIGRALDAGAAGIIVPLVGSVDEAAAAVAACRYPPLGQRSWGPLPALWGHQVPVTDQANADVTCAVMVESPQAVEQVEAIAAVEGVDMLFVGPFDLSLASGTTVDALLADNSPSSALAQVVGACTAAGIKAGAYAGTIERGRILAERGFTAVAIATDNGLLTAGAHAAIATWRAAGPEAR
jgi:4-hydroxy-2-oxoheptanedioate aldolase